MLNSQLNFYRNRTTTNDGRNTGTNGPGRWTTGPMNETPPDGGECDSVRCHSPSTVDTVNFMFIVYAVNLTSAPYRTDGWLINNRPTAVYTTTRIGNSYQKVTVESTTTDSTFIVYYCHLYLTVDLEYNQF